MRSGLFCVGLVVGTLLYPGLARAQSGPVLPRLPKGKQLDPRMQQMMQLRALQSRGRGGPATGYPPQIFGGGPGFRPQMPYGQQTQNAAPGARKSSKERRAEAKKVREERKRAAREKAEQKKLKAAEAAARKAPAVQRKANAKAAEEKTE